MGLLPSKQLVDLLEPTPCLAQLMVQVQLSFSLLDCISLLPLLGQPADTCRGTHPVSQGHAIGRPACSSRAAKRVLGGRTSPTPQKSSGGAAHLDLDDGGSSTIREGAAAAALMQQLRGYEAVSEQFMGVPCSSPELRFPRAV